MVANETRGAVRKPLRRATARAGGNFPAGKYSVFPNSTSREPLLILCCSDALLELLNTARLVE